VSVVSTVVEDPMRRGKNDTETTVALETSMDNSSSSKRRHRVTFERESSRKILSEILDEPDPTGQTQSWPHPIVVALETIASLTLLSRSLWLFKGMFFVLVACIAFIVRKWVIYIIHDEELRRAKQGLISYFSLAMREAEKTIKGGKRRQMMEASALALRGTAQSFTVWFLQQRNAALLKQTRIDMTTVKQRMEIIREKLTLGLAEGLSITSNIDY
jgi:hypothetical protein